MVKINLGSGPSGVNGWENYDWGLLPLLGKFKINLLLAKIGLLSKDYAVYWPNIKLSDIRKKIPKKNNSVDYIFCSHVLEHFEKYQSLNVLIECKRVLKKGGWLRVVLPDIEKIRKIADAETFNKAYLGIDKSKYITMINKLKLFFIRPHLWMYNIESFTLLLREAGFKEIIIREYRQGAVPDLDKLDLKIHHDLSFYIEACN